VNKVQPVLLAILALRVNPVLLDLPVQQVIMDKMAQPALLAPLVILVLLVM
jgi:hypothetical protein